MLTAVQTEIIRDILELNQNTETITIKTRGGLSQNYSYGSVSASRRDLDRLRERHLISFKRGYCEPQVTETGLLLLQQFRVLQMLDDQFSEQHSSGQSSFVDEAIAEDTDLCLSEVQALLADLKEKELIDGYFCASSDQSQFHRLVNIWVTSQGKKALGDPDAWWEDTCVHNTVSPPLAVAQPPADLPLSARQSSPSLQSQRSMTPEAAAFSEKTRLYIEALRKLAQSLPEERRSEVMALLRDLTQAVDCSRQCA
jgi:hypothetical protein